MGGAGPRAESCSALPHSQAQRGLGAATLSRGRRLSPGTLWSGGVKGESTGECQALSCSGGPLLWGVGGVPRPQGPRSCEGRRPLMAPPCTASARSQKSPALTRCADPSRAAPRSPAPRVTGCSAQTSRDAHPQRPRRCGARRVSGRNARLSELSVGQSTRPEASPDLTLACFRGVHSDPRFWSRGLGTAAPSRGSRGPDAGLLESTLESAVLLGQVGERPGLPARPPGPQWFLTPHPKHSPWGTF